ncbi:MAG: PD40 domain-containing protein, partial [Acidobacteria bacterium]|nr:PD40 domain-containing protein [Acidobacteriota bacterium]
MTPKVLMLAAVVPLCGFSPLCAQEAPITIRPRPQEEIILAVPDAQPQSAAVAPQLAEALRTFNQVLWDDLKFSGHFTLAGKSFYPLQPIVKPEDINYGTWDSLPFKVSFLTAGTLDLVGGILRAELRVFDMKQRSMSFGQRISGDQDQVRAIAHRWADEIVYKLTAGQSRGIASTKIAYTSRRGAGKEVYVMDYDGFDQRAFTHNGSINLFPAWAPDNSKIAFTSSRTGRWEINIHSYVDGSRLPFPMFNSFATTPAISPDGTQIVFSLKTARGDADIFIANLDGTNRRNITNNPAIDTSPTWSPSGKQIAFVSSREALGGQIFVCDIDGANVRRILKEGGMADSPSWSPDGRYIAFHWKPRMAEN